MVVDPVTWRNNRPRKRMGAGALILDMAGRVLVVEPTYKDTWELPGGSVEADESPRAACVREIEEELGMSIDVGRLLCLEWQGPEPDRTESVIFVYDGGLLSDPAAIQLLDDELASFRLVEPDELEALMPARLARRTRAALRALANGELVELEKGMVVGVAQAAFGAPPRPRELG